MDTIISFILKSHPESEFNLQLFHFPSSDCICGRCYDNNIEAIIENDFFKKQKLIYSLINFRG